MNLEHALKIPGFTNVNELRWLAEQASTRRHIVEIGSWKGRGTRAMADNIMVGASVCAVDTWNGTAEDWHMEELAGKHPDWLYNEFIANVSGSTGVVRPYRTSSLHAADEFRQLGLTFDMIFIDAAHDYQNVKDDVLAWRPLLAPGGLLCGHDFEPGRGGVIQAVKECIPNARRLGIGTIWI